MKPNDNTASSTTRRDFLRTTAAASAIAVPYFAPASVFGAIAPSNRINMACIGVGNQGFPVMKRFLQHDDCQVLAVCDVNRGSYGYKEEKHFYGREPAKKEVERHYAKHRDSGEYEGCEAYNDYRDVLAREDIDAVVIASPDHWHSLMTIHAAEAGKDIYCEKPLGLTIGDQQAMVQAVRKHQRVLQTGSHERSNPNVRAAVEMVRNGAIGKLKRIVTHVGRHNKVGPGPGWEPTPIPEGFDYDMWLGPAPEAPFHKDRCLYRFRFNYDYAGGQITNFGAHSNDMAQWALGMDDSGPVKVEFISADYLPKGSLYDAATHIDVRYTYANGVELECFTSNPSVRCIFEGSDGVIRVDNKGQNFATFPESIKSSTGIDYPEVYASNDDHQRNFLDCVKSRDEPNAPVEVGHRSGSVCHLGNIAIALQTKLEWDPKAEQFVGSDEANALLNRPIRSSWQA